MKSTTEEGWTGSIFPPPPFDEAVKRAFPGRRQRSECGDKAAPSDGYDNVIRLVLVSLEIVTLNVFLLYFDSPSFLAFVLLNLLIAHALNLAYHNYTIRIALLMLLSVLGSLFPLVFMHHKLVQLGSHWVYGFMVLVCVGPTVLSLPDWVVYMNYRPAVNVIPKPVAASEQVAVDVLLTTYREDIDEILGTLAAIQNLEWEGAVNVYVLDDGNREDVRVQCASLTRTRHPVTRVTRAGNAGGKAGNLNHFLRRHPRTADFFVTLDCDMRPFPSMLQLLFAAYHAVRVEERRRIGFITTPQFFRNYDSRDDVFDTVSTMFANTTMHAMHAARTVLYIGTNALVRRDAVERAGLFYTDFATEDCSTGCKVHATRNEFGEPYTSVYLPVPVAAGLSPRTLAQLLSQRFRWHNGMSATSMHYRYWVVPDGTLTPMQRFIYFTVIGAGIRNIFTFLLCWFGTVFVNLICTLHFELWVSKVSPSPSHVTLFYLLCIALVLVPWLLVPGSSIMATLRALRMQNVYVSTEFPCLLLLLGVRVRYRWSSQCESARWSPHFYLPATAYCTIVLSAVALFLRCVATGTSNCIPVIQAVFSVLLWTYKFYPILLALFGHQNDEHPKWLVLEEGRQDLFKTPVWSEADGVMIEQLKILVCHLYRRLEKKERIVEPGV